MPLPVVHGFAVLLLFRHVRSIWQLAADIPLPGFRRCFRRVFTGHPPVNGAPKSIMNTAG